MISKGSFISLGSIDSTNDFAMQALREGLASHGMTWFARYQNQGKGQHGKKWSSAPGENIIMSSAIQPGKIFQGKLFHFNAMISLVCLEFLKEKTGIEVKLKWPNDLYVGDKKLGGILIENIFRASTWNWSVVGIGINVNQEFSKVDYVNAVSLFELTNQKNNPESLARELHERLLKAVDGCSDSMLSEIPKLYNTNLYRKDEIVRLMKENLFFETLIIGVDDHGRLISKVNGVEKRFQNGEVEWVIKQ